MKKHASMKNHEQLGFFNNGVPRFSNYSMSFSEFAPSRLLDSTLKARPVEAFKFVFFGTGSFDILGLSYSLFFASTVLFFGVVIFNKTEKSFMDTV